MKRILAGFMAVIIMLSSPAYAGLTYAEEKKADGDTVRMVPEEGLKVEGTNSFGSLLANTLAGEAEGQSDNEGYNIFSIDIQGKMAQVSFETMEDASLVVGIYDESGIEMLASGTIAVTPDEKAASIAIDIERMPEYFYLRGFMVDEKTLRPLCTAYESPNYTKEMKEFFAKTTNDFDKEKVLNLDDDESNNFAVFSDAVTVVPSGSAMVVEKIDEENKKYVFSNADSIKSLKHGDIFSYEYEDGNTLIVKIDSILEENGMVTVVGQDAVMEDVFEHVKIDTDAGITEGTEVDTSECGDGVIYNGIVYEDDNADGEMHINAKEFDKKTGGSLSYKFLENETKGISGDVTVKLEAGIKVYISHKYKYLEVRTDYSVKARIGVKAKSGDDWRLPLGVVPFTPIPGINLKFTTAFVVEVSASFEISGTLKGTLGFKAESDKGIQNISSSPEFIDLDAKGEITVFVGLSLKAEVNIVSDYLANAELEATLGAEVTGELKPNKSSSSLHECKMCVDGDVSAKAGWEFKTELLNSDKLTFKLSDNISLKVADWYFSFDFGDCAMTTCPHYLYKTTITVKELMKEKYIAGAVVKVPFTIIEKDENGNEKKTKVSSVTTNENGKVEGYLPSGKYNIEVNAEKYYKKKEKVTIEDEAKSIGIELSYDISDIITGEEPGDDTILKKNIQKLSLGGGHSGVITEDGSLYIWGNNMYGQLGNGTTEYKSKPIKVLDNAVSVSLGDDHSGAVTEDGSLYTWGDNQWGQLGNGTKEEKYKPTKVLEHVASVSLGMSYSGAITEDGSLYMWGYNGYGQIGDGTTENKYKPVKILEHVVSVNLGMYHSGAITEDGSLYMWGRNMYGELGDGTIEYRYKPVKVLEHVISVSLGAEHSGAITKDGSLYMWGHNDVGQLGDDTEEDSNKPIKIMDHVALVSLGDTHSGAITEDGSLYMWGYNWCGELGDGTTEDSNKPIKVMDNIKFISLGAIHSGAITEDGSLYMWGSNESGQLGNGIIEGGMVHRPSLPTKIMENIKINNKQVISIKDILDKTEHRVSIKKLGDFKPTETTNQGANKTASFTDLVQNAIYNFYVVKNKTAESLLHTSNLLYLTQATAGADGSLYVSYGTKENSENAEIFVVCAEQDDIASATVNVQDLEYNQKQQYIQPVVTYQGKMLNEYEDYELLGDYSATEIGNYTVTIHGIGDYKGSIDASYKITEPKSRKIEKITLSVADASLNKGNTLQLTASVFPENAENKTLQWSSSDEKVAIVDNNGVVTAVGAGKATITVKSTDGSDISASCIVVITDNSPNPQPIPIPAPTPIPNPSPAPSPVPDPVPNPDPAPDPEPNPGPVIESFYYIIQFDGNSGAKLSRKTLTLLFDDNLGILPKVQRKNYKFKGWYTQKSGGDKVNSASVLNVSTTLYAQWKRISKPVKVKKITLSSKKSGQMKVSWKKVLGAFGYQVMYSTSKKFTNATTKKVSVPSVSRTIKSLKKGKAYYVKIRAYKIDSAGNKRYGAYSAKKYIKVKK